MASEIMQTDLPAPTGKTDEIPRRPPRRRLLSAYALATAYVVFGAGIVVLLPPPSGDPWSRTIALAVLVGVVLGQSTCAGIWMSFGTGNQRTRAHLGLMWMLLMVAALATRFAQTGQNGWAIAMFAAVIAAVLMVQVAFTRFLLWITRASFGIALQAPTAIDRTGDRNQFGIAQMLAFTTLVAILLAVGRGVVQWLAESDAFTQSPLPLYLFVATATVLVSLPLAAASLLDRHPIIAILIAALLVSGATAMELPILAASKLTHGDDLNLSTLASINLLTSLTVVGYTLGLRLFGFRLEMGKARSIATN